MRHVLCFLEKKASAVMETVTLKGMRTIKAYETQRWTPSMCRLGRTRRKKYERRGEKWCGVARTDEARKWDERPRGEVEGNGDPHCRSFSKIQTDRPLKISQSGSAKKSKLIRDYPGDTHANLSRLKVHLSRRSS